MAFITFQRRNTRENAGQCFYDEIDAKLGIKYRKLFCDNTCWINMQSSPRNLTGKNGNEKVHTASDGINTTVSDINANNSLRRLKRNQTFDSGN